MESTPDGEEKMPAAAPEQTEVYRIEEDGDDLVIRVPRSVVSRERVQALLDALEPGQVHGRTPANEKDAARVTDEIRRAVWELLGTASTAGPAVDDGETAAVGLPDEKLEQLHFMSRVERGLRQIDAGEFVSHEEAKRRLGR
jgi:predicted transcriptional regulator